MPPLFKSILLLLVVAWSTTQAQTGELSVYVFVSPDCPLCQNYTRTLNQLEQQYAGKVTIKGIVPGKTVKDKDVATFRATYHVGFSLQQDRDLHITRSMHATTTPEVILLAADRSVLYQGAIDNWYKSLGRAAGKPTANYLQDAIESALHHQPISIKQTTPVGCLINDF